MRALVVERLAPDYAGCVVKEIPTPEPGPGQVRIKVGGAGACHSDLHLMEWTAETARSGAGYTLGHENAGWVAGLGQGVRGFREGDAVVVTAAWGGGACGNCRRGWDRRRRSGC